MGEQRLAITCRTHAAADGGMPKIKRWLAEGALNGGRGPGGGVLTRGETLPEGKRINPWRHTEVEL